MLLTPRESEILKAIIDEYVTTAQPIASIELVQKQGLNVSGATVRNVMSSLVNKGYLQMPHVSSGRIPTDRAYRYYITELMEEVDLSVLDEVSLKQQVWTERYELERLLCKAVEALSNTSNTLTFSLTSDGYLTYSGTSKVFESPEFFEIEVTRAVFRLVDDYDLANSILQKAGHPTDMAILIGREIGLANMEPIAFLSTHCKLKGKDCYIGLLCPSRTRYSRMIPLVRYMSGLLTEVGENL